MVDAFYFGAATQDEIRFGTIRRFASVQVKPPGERRGENAKEANITIHDMSRSSKKGPYVDQKLLKKVAKLKSGDRTVIKTWSRSSEISPEMVGFVFGVYNGKNFIEVEVKEEMVGHRLGEFSPTRKFIKHDGKIRKTSILNPPQPRLPQKRRQPNNE